MKVDIPEKTSDKRLVWSLTRSVLESDSFKYKRFGGKRKSYWTKFERLIHLFGFLLKIVGLYQKGNENAKNISVKKINLTFADLPDSFDGYRILHLTDLHLDCITGIETIIAEKIAGLQYDICVITGDYREKTFGSFRQILPPLRKIVQNIHARDGIYSVLGNHDTFLMVKYLENMGIAVLANETVSVQRNGEKMFITGIDDPNYYYTDQTLCGLEEKWSGFKIAIVHSPELYDIAGKNRYRLYICGHTHGGQICLPGGRPVITHTYNAKHQFRGLWQYNGMTGYTSCGCGASGIPVRFNCEGEVTLFTLMKENRTN